MPLKFTFLGEAPRRADHVVAEHLGTSRARAAALFVARRVYVNHAKATKGARVVPGDEIELRGDLSGLLERGAMPDQDAAAQLNVLWQEADWIAFAKPAGMPTLPLDGGERGCAANGLAHLFPEMRAVGNDPRECGLVHRLDTNTSGVMVAARTPAAWHLWRDDFASRRVRKRYLALVHGAAVNAACDAPLLQRGNHVVVHADGMSARTEITPLVVGRDLSLVCCATSTGRMHQIRAHLAHLGTPIWGDVLYGAQAAGDEPFYLHAWQLVSPRAALTCPLPALRRHQLGALLEEAETAIAEAAAART